jgi:hypothetical protein
VHFRSLNPLAFTVLASLGLGSGCGGGARPQPEVVVMVRGLGALQQGHAADEFTLQLLFDVDIDPLPGDEPYAVPREIFWDGTEPFRFEVQVPERTYRRVRLGLYREEFDRQGEVMVRWVGCAEESLLLDARLGYVVPLQLTLAPATGPCR